MVDKQTKSNIQTQYTEENFNTLLAKIPTFDDANQAPEVVETLRVLAEFVCFSE